MRIQLTMFLVAAVACSSEVGVLLDAPRVVAMQVEPPALVPPGEVTATIKIFDPEFRVPTIRWYVSANPPRADVDYLNQDLSDPADIDDPDRNLLYVGDGTQVVLPVPSVPDDMLPSDVDAIFDTFPFYALASVKLGDMEFKGFKQIRVVLPTLVRRVLERQCTDDPNMPVCVDGIDDAEVDAAIAIRLNRAPKLTGLDVAIVEPDGEYTLAMTMDLLKRREAPTAAAIFATGIGAKQALRLLPQIDDPDLAANPEPGQPGYNKIEVDVLATAGKFYPLSLTAFDWVPFEVKGGGFAAKPKLEGGPHPLVTVQATVYDRQGGVDNVGFEIDNGEPPRESHRGTAGSVLVAEGKRMQWLRVGDAATLAAIPLGQSLAISASVSYEAIMPHGIVARLDTFAVTSPVTATTFFDGLDRNPYRRHEFDATPIAFIGVAIRTWQP